MTNAVEHDLCHRLLPGEWLVGRLITAGEREALSSTRVVGVRHMREHRFGNLEWIGGLGGHQLSVDSIRTPDQSQHHSA
jgi:hypothetical protein